jgi:hypothetical protein
MLILFTHAVILTLMVRIQTDIIHICWCGRRLDRHTTWLYNTHTHTHTHKAIYFRSLKYNRQSFGRIAFVRFRLDSSKKTLAAPLRAGVSGFHAQTVPVYYRFSLLGKFP